MGDLDRTGLQDGSENRVADSLISSHCGEGCYTITGSWIQYS